MSSGLNLLSYCRLGTSSGGSKRVHYGGRSSGHHLISLRFPLFRYISDMLGTGTALALFGLATRHLQLNMVLRHRIQLAPAADGVARRCERQYDP